MRRKVMLGLTFGLTLAAASLAVLAEDPFHIGYRHQALQSDGMTQSGMLLVTVVNVSGEDAFDLVLSIPDQNNVTFDNRTLYVGDMADGQQVEVLDPFTVPQEVANPEATEEQVTWSAEFTASDGRRIALDVTGQKVPQ